MVIRKLVLAGDYSDTDWTDPAIAPPDNARRFRILSRDMTFAVRGRSSSAPDAPAVSLGGMTIDAYVLIEIDDKVGGPTRGKSVAEVEGGPLDATIFLRSSGLPTGRVGRVHVDLVGVTAPVVEVVLLDGGRPL